MTPALRNNLLAAGLGFPLVIALISFAFWLRHDMTVTAAFQMAMGG